MADIYEECEACNGDGYDEFNCECDDDSWCSCDLNCYECDGEGQVWIGYEGDDDESS